MILHSRYSYPYKTEKTRDDVGVVDLDKDRVPSLKS